MGARKGKARRAVRILRFRAIAREIANEIMDEHLDDYEHTPRKPQENGLED